MSVRDSYTVDTLLGALGDLAREAAKHIKPGMDGYAHLHFAQELLDAPQPGPNERLLAALKNWDEEWGEVARHDSYAAPWDRELGQAIEEWRTTATHGGPK